jgi:hypothetical protein
VTLSLVGGRRAYRGMGMSPGRVVVMRMAEAGAGADEVAANRELWTRANSEYTDEHALRAWAAEDIAWGIFNVPGQQLGVPGDVGGVDAVEPGPGLSTMQHIQLRDIPKEPSGSHCLPGSCLRSAVAGSRRRRCRTSSVRIRRTAGCR